MSSCPAYSTHAESLFVGHLKPVSCVLFVDTFYYTYAAYVKNLYPLHLLSGKALCLLGTSQAKSGGMQTNS